MKLSDEEKLIERLKDRTWRLNNLYRVKPKEGGKDVVFRLNPAQEHLYGNMHYFNVILKARQLGFTTFLLTYFLDACLFNSNHQCGVVAHHREAAEDLFRNKVRWVYNSLPDWLKELRPAKSDTSRLLEFENGSSMSVGTSLRSGTYQKLLISEYGKVSAREPEKSDEIKTGALNTVQVGQQVFVESTAEGQSGNYYDLVQRAKILRDAQTELSPLDPKFFFFSWTWDKQYALSDNDTANTKFTTENEKYFEKLEQDHKIILTPNQKAWYAKKAAEQGDMMLREFPSTDEEAFRGSMEGAYFQREIDRLRTRKQICRVPYEPSRPVHTFWDLGNRDATAIWFFQHIGMEYRFIDYWEGSDVGGLPFIARVLQKKDYIYGRHYFPHDGGRTQFGVGKLLTETAENLGIRPVRVVPRTPKKIVSIEKARLSLPRCFFDAEMCATGIKHLESYRKQWNAHLGCFDDNPLHDHASNCADAFMTFSDGYDGRHDEFIDHSDRKEYSDTDYDVFTF